MAKLTKTIAVDPDKFWQQFNGLSDSICWECKEKPTKAGYARVWIYPKTYYAHRVAWELYHKQRIPSGMLVCHKCDNPSCCNPKHLFLGTCKDNSEDCVNKGRHRNGIVRGEQHPLCKLTTEQVEEIKRIYVPSTSTKYSPVSIKSFGMFT